MLNRAMQRRRAGEGGFTLIELLVVIVILGILAAIVVFAIGGLTDSSQKSACNADAATLQTAEDAYYASPSVADPNVPNQTYADEATLVSQKLIKKLSTNWNITGAGASAYTLTKQNSKCGADIVGP